MLLRLRNVSDESYRENQNTHFVFNNFFFFHENFAVCETLCEKYCRAGRPTDGKCNTTRALCVLGALSPKQTRRILQYLSLYHGNNAYANALQCYVLCSLPVLLIFTLLLLFPSCIASQEEPTAFVIFKLWAVLALRVLRVIHQPAISVGNLVRLTEGQTEL